MSSTWKFEYSWYPVEKWQQDIYWCLDAIYEHCILSDVKDILEIGTGCNGCSTWLFKRVIDKTNGHLTSVDIVDYSKVEPHPRKKFIKGDSKTVDIKGTFDAILLDSSHMAEDTRVELNKYVPMLRKGGLLFMHDVNLSGVSVPLTMYLHDNNNLKRLISINHGTTTTTGAMKMDILKKL